jgi:uroporphyrin-III C-methyltransferase
VNKVAFVGAGPGAPDLLTRRGRDRLAAAEVVVIDRPSLDELVGHHAPADAVRVHVGRTPTQAAWDLDRLADLLADHQRAGRRVVRLKLGDLFVCSRGAEEVAALAERRVPVELVPGVSAAVAAPLAAGRALLPAGTGAFTVVAGNEDPVYPPVDWRAVAAGGGAVVVLMGRAHQRVIADRLVAGGRDPQTIVHLVHAATRPDEQVRATTLAELGSVRLSAPATFIVAPADRG